MNTLARNGFFRTGFLYALLCVAAATHAGSIWIEGEDADIRENTPHRWWYDTVKKDVLSGGGWISHFNKDAPGRVGFRFAVETGGTYTFWLRANPAKSRLSWRLDGGTWQPVDFGGDLRGKINIAADNKPDLRYIAWVKVGGLKLAKGDHLLECRFHSDARNHGAIDCLCLSDEGFVPSGTRTPGGSAAGTETVAGPKDAVWIEGESAADDSFTGHSWYDSVKKDVLSGGTWLSNFNRENATARYTFQIVAADTYTFWLRANPVKAKMRYRLDGGDWKPVDFGTARDRINIAADNKPDLRFIGWVRLGTVDLDAGKHTASFSIPGGVNHHGAIDCFAFVRIPFAPSGARKPAVGKPGSAGPKDWFVVVPDDDAFSERSVIDLSGLNEPTGTHGFLRRDGDALRFEKADAPVKFWGCGFSFNSLRGRDRMLRAVKFLAKHGINMIRQHTVISAVGFLKDGAFDADRIDAFDWFVSLLAKHGIYMTWSINYPHHGPFIRKEDGYPPKLFAELKPNRDGVACAGDLVNFMRPLQDIQYRYLKALLAHKNPYTGRTYADEPTLAVLEIQNESCAFWHGALNRMRAGKLPEHARIVRGRWFRWCKQKYGSEKKLREAWGGLDKKDDWAGGELALMGAYHLGAKGPRYEYTGRRRRAGDFIRFLAGMQRAFYDRRVKEMRDRGFKGVTVTTAWRSGGPAAEAANLWCDTAGDMIDRHNYFGGGAGRHRIVEGAVNAASHLTDPGSGLLGLGMLQVDGRPFSVSEWSMMPPNPCKLEAAPLVAFYGMGLQGWDSSLHFNGAGCRIGSGWPGLSKYVTFTPHYIGQFPALAFAVRKGHVAEGDVVAVRRLSTEDLFAGVDPLGQDFTGGGHDIKNIVGAARTPPACLAAGRVTIAFEKGEDEAADPGTCRDPDAQVIRSSTGQLVWDYGTGVVQLTGPKTQAVVGRADGASFDLDGVRLDIATPFVSVIFTPLDDRPLAESGHILLTAMARDRQTGTAYGGGGKQLVRIGGPPLEMEPVRATVRLKGDRPKEVNILDIYGVPTGRTVEPADDGSFAIDGRWATYYYEIKR